MLGPTERVARCRGVVGVVGVVGLEGIGRLTGDGGKVANAGDNPAEGGGEGGGSVANETTTGGGVLGLFKPDCGRCGALAVAGFILGTSEAGERERWLEASSELGTSSSLDGAGVSWAGSM